MARRQATTEAAGERLRRARLALGRSRASVGDQIGVSASMIGRMERGEGDGLLVRHWVAAAHALGYRLLVSVESDPDDSDTSMGRSRVLTVDLIRQIAAAGEWRVVDHDDFRVVLDRAKRGERLLVYLCDLPVEILDAVDARAADRATALESLPADWRVGVLIIVRAELRDRYRPLAWLGDERAAFWATGSDSIAALKSPRVALRSTDALVWCDERATRLIPFGLDLEPGRRGPRKRPEIRRRACPRPRPAGA